MRKLLHFAVSKVNVPTPGLRQFIDGSAQWKNGAENFYLDCIWSESQNSSRILPESLGIWYFEWLPRGYSDRPRGGNSGGSLKTVGCMENPSIRNLKDRASWSFLYPKCRGSTLALQPM